MRQIIKDTFFDFTAQHEGFTPFMYCDILNLVTTGVGNLIDDGPNHDGPSTLVRARLNNVVSPAAMARALKLPWRFRAPGWTSKNPLAGELASPAEIADAWTRVKRQNEVVPDFSQLGGFKYAGLTNLTLDLEGLKTLFATTLRDFDNRLSKKYPGYESWPADAQLAILSMSWAMGPAFFPVRGFQAFKAAADVRDFDAMAVASTFKGGGQLTDPKSRNAENFLMFRNANVVEKGGGDPDLLIFPGAGRSVSGGSGAISISPPSNTSIGDVASTVLIGGGAAAVAGWGLWKLFKRS